MFSLLKHNPTLCLCISLLLAVVLLLVASNVFAAREVSDKRECATCHIMWLKEFKQKDVSPLVAYDPMPSVESGKQDVSSTEKMCFSCHDGFVLDSRFMWKDKSHSHPVGRNPPADMRIPTSDGKTVFPLNADGKVYCGTCHTAHGVNWQDSISPIFLRVRNVNSTMCLACHLPKTDGPAKGMHPVFEHPKQVSRDLINAGARFGSDGSLICESCHLTHGAPYNRILVKDNKNSDLCQSCHVKQSQVIDTKHDIKFFSSEARKSLTGTDQSTGPCSACHVAHSAKGTALWPRAGTHNKDDPAAAACLYCHNPDGAARDRTIGDHSHPLQVSPEQTGVTTNTNTWTANTDVTKEGGNLKVLPLYNKNGHPAPINGSVSCGTCHDPHTWSPDETEKNKNITRRITKKGDGNSSFLRIAQNNQSTLCLNCHINQRKIINSPHDLSSSLLSGRDISSAWPNEDSAKTALGTCETCHRVHNASGQNLRVLPVLAAADLAGNGNPEVSLTKTWCLNCHSKDGIAEAKIVSEHSHPVGIEPDASLTRHSSLPLYSSSGEKSGKRGLIDCATCHDPHNWTEFPQLSDTEFSGEKETSHAGFLRLPVNGDSRLCLECHEKQGLVSGTDHDMRVTNSQSINILGRTVHESGLCGQCHTMHSPAMSDSLWARNPGDDELIKNRQCSSCHSKTGMAKDKTPEFKSHPEYVMAWSNTTRANFLQNKSTPDLPVFDEKGIEQQRGQITCASCHDPHQWSPRSAQGGSGKNEEGDVLSSFLRISKSEYIVCADCHGKDALYRYKYFHEKSSRAKHPLYR